MQACFIVAEPHGAAPRIAKATGAAMFPASRRRHRDGAIK